MARTAQLTVEDIKNAITKLSKDQIIEIDKEIHRYIETSMMMGASESAFFRVVRSRRRHLLRRCTIAERLFSYP